jgi:tyrosyl-tRNA synthetase
MTKNFKSEFLQELSWRGFIAQITHEEPLDDLMAKEKITAYIGFDCTAKTLHVGSLIQIMILRLLKKHGHNPFVLLGGGTTKIGDPSGKDEARKILSEADIQENLNGIEATIAKFKPENGEKSWFKLVNNDDWLKNLNYLEFLRDIGRHFSINRMLSFDSVKLRLERDQSLSFLEFNYMILQAYDFYVLNRDKGCVLQIGGSDQWGNIVNGVELIRRKNNDSFFADTGDGFGFGDGNGNGRGDGFGGGFSSSIESSFGLTSPLLTTSDGKKMGKTADGAVWLDENLLSVFDYFQFWRNTTDADTIKFLKLFTDLTQEEIAKLAKFEGQEINKAKEILAFEATKICHGEQKAQEALKKAQEIFIKGNSQAFEEKKIMLNGAKKLVEIIKEIGACASNGEARRLIEGGGVKIDDEKVGDVDLAFTQEIQFNLQVGKKKFYKIVIEKS